MCAVSLPTLTPKNIRVLSAAQVEVVEVQMTLNMDCADFDITVIKLTLAEQYKVDVELISLDDPCSRRRARSLATLTLTIQIASTATAADGSTLTAPPAANILAAVQQIDDSSLTLTLGVALGATITVTSTPPKQAMVTRTLSVVCPKGKWCTAGLIVDCPLGSYNNITGQDFATACKL